MEYSPQLEIGARGGQKRGAGDRSAFGRLLFSHEPERLISFCRLVFCCFAFPAIYLDPTKPAGYVDEVFLILISYSVYSLLLWLALQWTLWFQTRRWIIHSIDILVLIALVHFTGGAGSPFFAFLTFGLLTAALRWNWRATLVTAGVLGSLLLALSWTDLELSLRADSELNLVILRGAFLVVAAAILGYFGAQLDWSRTLLVRLADWPVEPAGQSENRQLKETLRHAATMLDTSRLLVPWQTHDGRPATLSYWSEGEFHSGEAFLSSEWFDALPREACFMATSSKAASATLHAMERVLAKSQAFPPVNSHTVHGLALAPFHSEHYRGGILVLNPRYRTEDVIQLTKIAASHIAAELERAVLSQELAVAASNRERIRLARDMHDSVLQDLTAASLKLKSVSARLPAAQSEPLKEVAALLLRQQERIREFVETARRRSSPLRLTLVNQLTTFIETLRRQWQCDITLKILPPDLKVASGISAEICGLLSEATANAVRHGSAKAITASITQDGDDLKLLFRDDGQGFGDQPPTEAEPYSLRGRVAELGGNLELVDTGSGVELSIELRP